MRKLLISTTVLVGILAAAPAFAAISADALPNFSGSATNANVDFSKQGANNHYADVNVQITGGQGSVGEVQWGSFNVGSNKGVNFEFTAHNQTALNKVDQAGGLSQIYGKITNSGCDGCGYASTSKVILLNPNGVFFGEGANVNLNSFTVSTLDGSYDKDTKTLKLERNTTSPYGIRVDKGATVHADKNVTFASDNVILYGGSKISTNVAPNVGNDSYGKVKIVTADGVNFTYYNNGTVKEVGGLKGASQKMIVSVEKDASIDAGHIDIRNYSSNVDSVLNINGATLKATKAVSGNDGNIWLTASNKILLDGAKLETVNYEAGSANNAGGDISIIAGNKVSVNKNSSLKAVRDVEVISQKGDAVVEASALTAGRDIRLTAKNIASAQVGSTLTANGNITVDGAERAQIHNTVAKAGKEIKVTSDKDVWFSGANLDAAKITANATAGSVTGDANVNNKQTNLFAGKDINVTLANVASRQNGLVAEANNDVTIKTNGTLSVSRIVSQNGNVTLDSDAVIAGLPYTTEEKINDGSNAERSYIYVKNGKFTSTADYKVTASDTVENGKNVRHHIEYGENGAEKILLINPRDIVAQEPAEQPSTELASVDNNQTEMLNKLPKAPETYSINQNINNGRTSFVDVFAAASQIEIEEDEEE